MTGELELPPLGWFFVILAAVDLLGQIVIVNTSLDGWTYFALQGLAGVGTALLPVALLSGVPDADRTHRVLLGALGALAVLQLAVTGLLVFLQFQGFSDLDTVNTVTLLIEALIAASYLAYARGLVQLRGSMPTPSTRWILVGLVLIVAIPAGILNWPGPSDGTAENALAIGFFVVAVVSAAATAVAAWVAIASWLDRLEPRRFWMVLGGAALVTCVVLTVSDLQASLSAQLDSDLSGDLATIADLVSLVAIAAAIYAYARLLPEPVAAPAAPVDPGPPADPIEPAPGAASAAS